jgi:hypothetical protein
VIHIQPLRGYKPIIIRHSLTPAFSRRYSNSTTPWFYFVNLKLQTIKPFHWLVKENQSYEKQNIDLKLNAAFAAVSQQL